jgi:hypothetical protein
MNPVIRVLLCACIIVLPILGSAGPVQQQNTSEILSIQEYVIKTSSNEDGTLRRTISVVVRNETGSPLRNVYLHLDGMPSNVTGDGWAYFQELGVGASLESSTTVDYSVDLSRQSSSELELIWQIKTVIDGEQFIDEISVIEFIY